MGVADWFIVGCCGIVVCCLSASIAIDVIRQWKGEEEQKPYSIEEDLESYLNCLRLELSATEAELKRLQGKE